MTSLITKYLPKHFAEFELEPNITELLQKVIQYDCLNLLLISNAGCGKTSLIRTIVKSYFKGHPKSSENILFINSVKEQGIAFYRGDVKTFCSSLPTIPNKKRFVVLDDLDLINEQSQQIFRTCIDKYNKSVNFVASCTNPQKVIESLQSRLLSVRIPPLEPRSLKRIADNIIAKENLSLTPEALDYIIMVAQNSARSLINYLEKVALLDKHVDLSLAEALCTDIAWIYFEHYLQFCKSGNVKQAVDILYQFYHQGFSVMDILDNLFVFIKQTQTGLLSEQEVYQLVQILCRHIIMLQEIHVHQVELAFFTCKVIKTISSIV